MEKVIYNAYFLVYEAIEKRNIHIGDETPATKTTSISFI